MASAERSSSFGRATLCGTLAIAVTCARSRLALSACAGVSGGSGPSNERPGTEVIQSTAPIGSSTIAKRTPSRTISRKSALLRSTELSYNALPAHSFGRGRRAGDRPRLFDTVEPQRAGAAPVARTFNASTATYPPDSRAGNDAFPPFPSRNFHVARQLRQHPRKIRPPSLRTGGGRGGHRGRRGRSGCRACLPRRCGRRP